MKVRFKYVSSYSNPTDPFNGNYINMDRVPCAGERVRFSNTTRKVLNVTTELKGWKCYYTVFIEL